MIQFDLQARTRSLPRQGSNSLDKHLDLQQYLREGANLSYLKDQSESIVSLAPEECTEDCGNPSPESPEIIAGSGYITTKDPAVDNTDPTHLPSKFNVVCRFTGCARGDQNKSKSLPARLTPKFYT